MTCWVDCTKFESYSFKFTSLQRQPTVVSMTNHRHDLFVSMYFFMIVCVYLVFLSLCMLKGYHLPVCSRVPIFLNYDFSNKLIAGMDKYVFGDTSSDFCIINRGLRRDPINPGAVNSYITK